LPNFTFLIERLIPTFLELEGFDSLGYTYNQMEVILPKYQPFINDLLVLSDLKKLVNRYESDELFNIWNYSRQQFLQRNPNILGLE
jgi:hypothetical protein